MKEKMVEWYFGLTTGQQFCLYVMSVFALGFLLVSAVGHYDQKERQQEKTYACELTGEDWVIVRGDTVSCQQ